MDVAKEFVEIDADVFWAQLEYKMRIHTNFKRKRLYCNNLSLY